MTRRSSTAKGGFDARVRFAAAFIADGRDHSGRDLDHCFESHDGDAVALALYGRTLRNPDSPLAARLFVVLGREQMARSYAEHGDLTLPQLQALSARLIAEAEAAWVIQEAKYDAAAKARAQVQA
jgi:hypothetical protein